MQFVIDTLGNETNLKVIKSVEFALDEEALRVISLAKEWIPASDRGRKVKAYRVQPISVKFD